MLKQHQKCCPRLLWRAYFKIEDQMGYTFKLKRAAHERVPTEKPPQRLRYPPLYEPDESQTVRLNLMLSIWFGFRGSSVGFVGLKVIWTAYGHRSLYNEGLHTTRSIRQGVPSHWHYTDTRLVSRGALLI
jgi:hypothetical protein